jgi:hypothetical protein
MSKSPWLANRPLYFELAHLRLALVGGPEHHRGRHLPRPAQSEAEARGVVVAPVADVPRARGEAGKALDALGLEALVGEVERGAEGVVAALPRERRGHEQLHQVHARGPGVGAEAGEGIGLVVGVHAAVAVHGEPEREAGVDGAVIAEVGDEEAARIVAVVGPVRPRRAATGDGRAAVRHEEGRAQVDTVSHPGDACGVGRRGERVLRQRDADAAHALRLDAVAMLEVPGGRLRRERRERGRNDKQRPFHAPSPQS